jgi:uncharacterized protein GlcG (DUF336 family)
MRSINLLKRAKALTERVEAEATKAKVPVAVCIVDVHGNLVVQHRMNGAPLFSLEISERKAYTSALVRMRTADLLAHVQPGQPLYALPTVAGGRFCPMGGGIPLTEDGEVFAGVGVSGGTAEQDVAIVEAALREVSRSRLS